MAIYLFIYVSTYLELTWSGADISLGWRTVCGIGAIEVPLVVGGGFEGSDPRSGEPRSDVRH